MKIVSFRTLDGPTRLFYCGDQLATVAGAFYTRALISSGQESIAQIDSGQEAGLFLLAVDSMQSTVNGWTDHYHTKFNYTPYGFSIPQSSVVAGFNGQRRDLVTGCYLLGAGYRAFSPVQMRFNRPDSWSPFGKGGLNSYAFVSCDPVNFYDPTGHMQRAQRWKTAVRPAKLDLTPNSVPVAPVSPKARSNSSTSSPSASLTPSTPSTGSSSRSDWNSSQSSLSSSTSPESKPRWELDKKRARFKVERLTSAEQEDFDTFQNAIHNNGLHPKIAASRLSAADYKRLDKKTNLYQIRLSGGQRVTFVLEGEQAIIRQVGGHT